MSAQSKSKNITHRSYRKNGGGIAALLRWGVNLSFFLLLFAIGVGFIHREPWLNSEQIAHYSAKNGIPTDIAWSATGWFQALIHLDATALVQAAILILVFLPGMRVVSLFFGFLRERDWLFASFSFLVLTFMLLGLAIKI